MPRLFHVELFATEDYLADILGMATDIGKVRMIIDGENARDKRLAEAPIQAPAKAKHIKKRERGRPTTGVPDKVLAAVRQLQGSAVAKNGGGAPLTEVKKLVKSSSVSPVITKLIKSKKLMRTSAGHYKVA